MLHPEWLVEDDRHPLRPGPAHLGFGWIVDFHDITRERTCHRLHMEHPVTRGEYGRLREEVGVVPFLPFLAQGEYVVTGHAPHLCSPPPAGACPCPRAPTTARRPRAARA